MPRRPHLFQTGFVYHLISRITAREWFIGAEERRMYLSLFGAAISESDWCSFSYAVMSNHIHHGVVAGAMPLSSWLRPAHTSFAQWLNERRERIGAVFVRGPTAIGIREGGVARLVGYIHNNPVRAGLVQHAHETDWTSHRAYLDSAHRLPWLDVSRGLELAGFTDAASFDTWVSLAQLGKSDLDAIRLEPLARRGRKPGRPAFTGALLGDELGSDEEMGSAPVQLLQAHPFRRGIRTAIEEEMGSDPAQWRDEEMGSAPVLGVEALRRP